jgi:hypothetical protein
LVDKIKQFYFCHQKNKYFFCIYLSMPQNSMSKALAPPIWSVYSKHNVLGPKIIRRSFCRQRASPATERKSLKFTQKFGVVKLAVLAAIVMKNREICS